MNKKANYEAPVTVRTQVRLENSFMSNASVFVQEDDERSVEVTEHEGGTDFNVSGQWETSFGETTSTGSDN